VRRLLLLLCATALGSSVLGAVPAVALEPTQLSVSSADPLLNENGDGYWESATVDVHTEGSAARWVLAKGKTIIAEADLTPAQRQGEPVAVSSATAGGPLAAGTYTFTVTATAVGRAPTTRSTEIYVSTAPPLTALTPDAAVIHPRDIYPGVAHEASFRHGLDDTILQHGTRTFEVVGDKGALGTWFISPTDSRLHWEGLGSDGPARAGTYRVRLVVADDGGTRYGPLSRPFRLSTAYRVPQELTVTKKANATRTATLTQRGARVRVVRGSLHYRALNTDWRREPLVRTAHRVRVPRAHVPGTQVFVVVRGRWQWPQDPDAEVVTPDGRVRSIDVFAALSKRSMILSFPPRLIHPDGTIRFRILWSSLGPTGSPHRTGRVDSVGVNVWTYVWHDLD